VSWANTNPNSPDRPEDAAIDNVADDDVAANETTEITRPPTMPMRARTRAFLWLTDDILIFTLVTPC
jgi:hypothetical protein